MNTDIELPITVGDMVDIMRGQYQKKKPYFNNDSKLVPVVPFVPDIESLVPIMTSDTTPSGISSASSSFQEGINTNFAAFRAFDVDLNSYWAPVTPTAANNWLQYQFPVAAVLTRYVIDMFENRSWVVAGSNDGVTFSTVDTRTNAAASNTSYNVTTVGVYYLYYRFTFTDSGVLSLGVKNLQLFGYQNV